MVRSTAKNIVRKLFGKKEYSFKQPDTNPHKRKNFGSSAANKITAHTEFASNSKTPQNEIAIIGISGKFPMANELNEFWQNIESGKDCITEIPKDRWDWKKHYGDPSEGLDKTNIKWGGFLEGIEMFDPEFFEIPRNEAALLDPQERLLLMTMWKAIENAGIAPSELSKSPTGVFAAISPGEYYSLFSKNFSDLNDIYALEDLNLSLVPSRISHSLNLHGPSEYYDTACSSAIVALHRAIDAINNGECEQAIIGAVNLLLIPKRFSTLDSMNLLSMKGKTKSFQAEGDGYVRSEGVGAILIKPLTTALKNNDNIYAIVKGTGIAHGGKGKSLTAPNPAGIKKAMIQAYQNAQVNPSSVSYIEAHGIGSPKADRIEINAMMSAYQELLDLSEESSITHNPCYISSLKPTIGHTQAASGLAAIFKVILAMRNNCIPGIPEFTELNNKISLENSPFKFTSKNIEWKTSPRRASINSYSITGVNGHVVLEEYVPDKSPSVYFPSNLNGRGSKQLSQENESIRKHVIVLSAKSQETLKAQSKQILGFVEKNEEISLADIAYTLQTGRDAMNFRLALVVKDHEELKNCLTNYLGIDIENEEKESERVMNSLYLGKRNPQSHNLLSEKMLDLLIEENNLERIALCWSEGCDIPWEKINKVYTSKRIALPAYPFKEERFWLEHIENDENKPPQSKELQIGKTDIFRHPNKSLNEDVQEYFLDTLSKMLRILKTDLTINRELIDFGLDSISAMSLIRKIKIDLGVTLSNRELLEHPSIGTLTNIIVEKITSNEKSKEPSIDSAKVQPQIEHPISEGQKALWMLQELNPQMSAYNIPIALKIKQEINFDLLKKTFEFLLDKHPILNTQFHRKPEGTIMMKSKLSKGFLFEVSNINDLSEIELKDLLRTTYKQPFQLGEGPLMRVHVFSRSEIEHVLLITIHHIGFDGTSVLTFIKDFHSAYETLLKGHPLNDKQNMTTFVDFVEWEKRYLLSDKAENDLEYWKKQLTGVIPVLPLPIDKPRPTIQTYNGTTYETRLSKELTSQLHEYSKENKISMFVLLLGIYKILLYRYSGQSDIIVGVPTIGRPEKSFEKTVGYFINLVALRSQVNGEDLVSEYFKNLKWIAADMLDHANYPFSKLVSALDIQRTRTHHPLFQVSFMYQNFLHPDDFSWLNKVTGKEFNFEFVEGIHQEGEFDLNLEIFEAEEELILNFKYNIDLFSISTTVILCNHFISLIKDIVASRKKQDNKRIDQLNIITEEEKQQILVDWNDTKTEFPKDKCIHELFEQQAVKTPDKIAVKFCSDKPVHILQGNDSDELTYRELNEKANRLANYLREIGVGKEVIVGICVERSLDMLIGLLAILKSGGGYLPIDPNYPADRIEYIIENSNTSVLLTQEKLKSKLLNTKGKVISIDNLDISDKSSNNLNLLINQNNIAYVIYTSGSTGKPKGVIVEHGNVVNFLLSMGKHPGINEKDRLLSVTSISFDIHVLELYLPLIAGASLLIASKKITQISNLLSETIENEKISIIQATPTTFKLLVDSRWQIKQKLKILSGGEAISDSLKQYLLSFPNVALYNMYGPTETTVWSTVSQLSPDTEPDIGRPINNTQIYILDENKNPVPKGVLGEMYIAGDGVSRGYLNQDLLTNEKFVPNPFLLGTKMYKTGDIVRWLPNGEIKYVGRKDSQVKIRGYRIELGEIEAVLSKHKWISEVVVLAKENGTGSKILAAYIVSRNSIKIDIPSIKTYLSKKLPDYMIPVAFTVLDTLPLTPNKKVDRKALLDLKVNIDPSKEYVAPRMGIEKDLVGVFCDVLNVSTIGINDSFFELGGNSLNIIELTDKINSKYDLSLTPAITFEHLTINSLAKYLTEEHGEKLESYYRGSINMPDIQTNPTSTMKTSIKDVFIDRPPASNISGGAKNEAIAIIGVSGKFPMAKDLTQFWQNLKDGKDCIQEIPKSRWDWEEYYGDPLTEANKTNVKWGGFIEGIDEFDPLFFGISPREAQLMDPQQRLLMTYVWLALEDAGYTTKKIAGKDISMFVGTGSSGYSELLSKSRENIEAYTATSIIPSVGPNRMSYFLDIHGPSEPVETACSSSLVAIHKAVSSIQNEDCDMAFVGGVNIIIDPYDYVVLNKAGMLAEDGRCKAFSKNANGYVRGEGVGMLILKSLKQAEQDKDHIYGTIIASAVNHGGRGNSLTAPNPKAQAQLLKTAYTKSNIDPTTVSYIEAHGTGTALGDPIEINALKTAFKDLYKQKGIENVKTHCGLGSVKTNIGHLELAAGVAGVIKVLLQLKNKTLVKSLHSEEINPYIELEDSPFYILQEERPWEEQKDEQGNRIPRRAGVSSFGFGGVNAHVVIEEYQQPEDEIELQTVISDQNPAIIPLSAKTKTQLKQQATNLLEFLNESNEEVTNLANISYTLQVGREEMEERMTLIVSSIEELKRKLKEYIEEKENISELYEGTVQRDTEILSALTDDEDMNKAISAWTEKRKYSKLMDLWVKGLVIDWDKLYDADSRPRRVSLPTYPFTEERHWIDSGTKTGIRGQSRSMDYKFKEKRIHPLLHQNISTLEKQSFSSTFTGEEYFLTDHQIQERKILPAVAYLEMVRAAIVASIPDKSKNVVSLQLENVVWTQPFFITNLPKEIICSLIPEDNSQIAFEIYSDEDIKILYCQGRAKINNDFVEDEKVDINSLMKLFLKKTISHNDLYGEGGMIEKVKFKYGAGFRVIDKIYVGDNQILARLELPKEFITRNKYALHPSIMEGALHSSIGLVSNLDGGNNLKTALPFTLGKMEILDKVSEKMWATVKCSPSLQHSSVDIANTRLDTQKFDIDLIDESGKICVKIRELTYKILDAPDNNGKLDKELHAREDISVVLLEPVWKSSKIIKNDRQNGIEKSKQ